MVLIKKVSLVPRPSASRVCIAYVTFEPLSDSWHVCDARATGRRPGNEAKKKYDHIISLSMYKSCDKPAFYVVYLLHTSVFSFCATF